MTRDIAEDLRAALEEFESIAAGLAGQTWRPRELRPTSLLTVPLSRFGCSLTTGFSMPVSLTVPRLGTIGPAPLAA